MGRLPSLILLNVVFIASVSLAQEPEPALVLTPEKVLKSLGKAVYATCAPNVANKELVSQIMWRGPGDLEIPTDDGSITTLEGTGGPNELDMYIKILQADDVGVYTCSALYAGNQRLEAKMEVLSFKSIDFKDTETVQTPVKGTDAKIKCIVTSDPPPTVDWLKDGIKFTGDPQHIIQTDGILIKAIDLDDEGVYRCRARVPTLGQIDHRDIQVEVHELPEITLAPRNTSGVEKESVTFQCVAKGKPPPSYTWVDRENRVLNEQDGYFVDGLNGELRIMDLRPDHSGNYRCTAKNPAGDVTAEAYLRVQTKPHLEYYENVTMGAGDDAELSCTFSGDPLPEVVFKKETNLERFVNNVNEDLRIDVQQSSDNQGRRVGTMKIEGLMRKDDGLYSCTGVSAGGETVVWGHITVEFQPTFEDQTQDDFWSWERKAVNLTCLATSIPNATIQWYLRDDPIRIEDPNFQVVSQGPQGILQVTPMDGSYYDMYTCQARNTKGVQDHDVSLREVQKPGPVSSTQVLKKSATTVEWSIRDPLSKGDRPVLGYTIQFRLQSTGWDKSETKYFPKGNTYLIDHLVPENHYVFRFAAKNDVGNGEWSGEKSVEMPIRSAPEEPLIYSVDPKVVKEIPYPHHYELQWQVPLDNGVPIDHFLITYYKVVNKTKSGGFKTIGSQEEVQVPHPGKSTYKMEDLNSNTVYKIELRAHNELGNSRPAEALVKTAYGPPNPITAPKDDSEGSNPATVFAIVVVIVIILVIIAVDVICYFAKNIGVSAYLVRRCWQAGKADKDKEAMLEEAVTARDSDKQAIQKEEEKAAVENPLATSESQGSITKDSSV